MESNKESAIELANKQIKFFEAAIKQALVELNKGNLEDSNWERVRRAIFILQNELDWYNRTVKLPTAEPGKGEDHGNQH